ncbi:hypothetical protein OSB04_010512 [Centaurea solstitialis]|uniref:Uncharacterized protein n=1 Tax=Centaurea solstitialis TaxID=347529 RepID=A0AA38T7Q4_9ASTR|nr:hypothetical protein OSB04_010512 [Centaurea solstitialis]
MKSIETLDFSHNDISGLIPQSLTKVNELTILDVSYNKLTGRIPVGGQMRTMNELNYYANNSGLCGMQIRIKCPKDISSSEPIEKEDENSSWISWEGTLIGFPIGFFLSFLIMAYSLNYLCVQILVKTCGISKLDNGDKTQTFVKEKLQQNSTMKSCLSTSMKPKLKCLT